MKNTDPKILLTGGHAATTGIAVVEEIRKTKNLKNAFIYWLGSSRAMEGSKVGTLESMVFPNMGVKFISINAGKIQTKFTRHTIPSILKIPLGFMEAFRSLLEIKPNIVLSFGGYSSVPVVFWSWVFRIPVILHEQTVVGGRANISVSSFATKIALARPESAEYFPSNKSVITGNPLMANVLNVKPKSLLSNTPKILVIGGSRGSNFINELIVGIAKTLLSRFILIHVTGQNDFVMVNDFRESLPSHLKENYKVYESIDPFEMGSYYSQSDLIISRSGANSVSEIIYVKRPAIFIPLPRTFMNEQVKNAKYAQGFGLATVFLEKEATPQTVIKEISRIIESWQKIISKTSDIVSPDINASTKLVALLEKYI
ncbi:MAG TPA: UDP-N-acetylglucosamine--N-acetylmuramyl-(pentapeptide) pyrophosphoryl-undecaprenol N-acetylglucosamine transferase [Patescibacteria group bacterium]|nr:UDP-N-acetylglucosamine--N-acetylmuramyl-(pentapeptide) pyrophosphoryl-undecaprenol N-acetylglucosamine transferase [Patescibacteria group bacterium]